MEEFISIQWVNPKCIWDTFANSEDPDEMQHYAAFHRGLHCLYLQR